MRFIAELETIVDTMVDETRRWERWRPSLKRAMLEPALFGLTYGIHQLGVREDITTVSTTQKVTIIWSVEPRPREWTDEEMM